MYVCPRTDQREREKETVCVRERERQELNHIQSLAFVYVGACTSVWKPCTFNLNIGVIDARVDVISCLRER